MPEVQSRTYANPRRLPRRNYFQEGPGFLFVVTQGGRPPRDMRRVRLRPRKPVPLAGPGDPRVERGSGPCHTIH